MTCNPKYGTVGMIAFPYFWIVEFFGPIIELLCYVLMVVFFFINGVYIQFFLLLFLLSLLYGSLFSMGAVLLEEWSLTKYTKVSDIAKLFLYAMTESLWYRPMTLFWRCEGIWQMIKGEKGWGEMQRKGISR